MATKKTVDRIVQEMKRLGTYKDEYSDMINIYADLLESYNASIKTLKLKTSLIKTISSEIRKAIKEGGADVDYLIENAERIANLSAFETVTAAGGTKKSGLVASIEIIRKDILAYSDRLLLNPKSEKDKTTSSTFSKFDNFLESLENEK